jgi:hypothetical protein
MNPVLERFSKLLMVAVPVAATSVLVTLPSEAATLASSRSTTFIGGFNPLTFDLSTVTDTDTLTIATGSGEVTASANADAVLLPFLGFNTSDSSANGTGFNYLGVANSEAAVIGVFDVEEVFSFSFLSTFSLFTSIDNPFLESANAFAGIGFGIFNNDTGDLLDSFGLFGELSSFGGNTVPTIQRNSNLNVLIEQSSLTATGNQLRASALFAGQYSRTFADPTSLRLVAFQENLAEVQAVPTPGVLPGLLFNFVLLPLMQRRRKKIEQNEREQLAAQPVEVQNVQHELGIR